MEKKQYLTDLAASIWDALIELGHLGLSGEGKQSAFEQLKIKTQINNQNIVGKPFQNTFNFSALHIFNCDSRTDNSLQVNTKIE